MLSPNPGESPIFLSWDDCVLTTLEAGHATRIALSLSHANLSAAHRALEKGHPVKATVEVEAGSGGERQEYQVGVVLTWR